MSSPESSRSGRFEARPARALPVPPAAVPVNPAEAVPVARPVPVANPAVDPMLPPGATARTVPVSRDIAETAPATSSPVSSQALPPTPIANRPIPVATSATAVGVLDEEEGEEGGGGGDPAKWLLDSAPPWLVSLVFHTILLIVLSLLAIVASKMPGIEVVSPPPVYAEKLGEQVVDHVMQSADSELLELKQPEISLDDEFVDDPLASPPDVEFTLDAVRASSDLPTPSVGIALTGREKGMKEALLAAYGGTATTEAAVKMGLEWLKKNQQRDGLWSLKGPYSNGSGVENQTAATAMALLAFQGAGHTHLVGEHKEVVQRAWVAMLRLQDADGNFFKQGSFHHRLYTQAQATIAICELYGMTKDAKYKAPAQKALDYCFRVQAPSGGWRYSPNGESDTSVTGWFVMAAQSGLMAGLRVPSDKLDKISLYLDRATTDGGSQYAYRPGYGEKISMTAEGLLCRQYLGWKHDDPRLVRGANIVSENPINWDDQDLYYWYYATQMMHHMSGDWWNDWNRVMRQTVPERQTKVGREKGSWSPTNDAWGSQGGRLYSTCLSIYMLEIYYRHLPIYKTRLR